MKINRIRKYIVPNVMAMLGMSCYVLADTLFIARASRPRFTIIVAFVCECIDKKREP